VKPVALHPGASDEVLAAAAWYVTRGPSLGERFLAEFERALRVIASAPRSQPALDGDERRCLLRTFPYSVVYYDSSSRIVVLAVAHHAREPGYWRSRLDTSTLHDRSVSER